MRLYCRRRRLFWSLQGQAEQRQSDLRTKKSKFIFLFSQSDKNVDGWPLFFLQVKMGKLSVKEKENALNEVRILASFQ